MKSVDFQSWFFPLLNVHVSTGSVFKRIELVEYSLIKLVNKKIICFLVCIHLCQMCEHELLVLINATSLCLLWVEV